VEGWFELGAAAAARPMRGERHERLSREFAVDRILQLAGQGGPCAPTGKRTTTDYVYVMDFDGDKIPHMTKIWNSGWAMKELGWG
jgi:hypothetical protein